MLGSCATNGTSNNLQLWLLAVRNCIGVAFTTISMRCFPAGLLSVREARVQHELSHEGKAKLPNSKRLKPIRLDGHKP